MEETKVYKKPTLTYSVFVLLCLHGHTARKAVLLDDALRCVRMVDQCMAALTAEFQTVQIVQRVVLTA